MKNFKYPLAIEGTKEQLESLIPKLLELGYIFGDFGLHYSKEDKILLTYFGEAYSYKIGFNQNVGLQYDIKRTGVNAFNPDLVLALAAMVDDNKFYKGEAVICIQDSFSKTFTTNNLYIVKELNSGNDNLMLVLDNEFYYKHFRKATKEEIINHFTPKQIERIIIGYNIKDKFINTTKVIAKALDTLESSANDKYWLPTKGVVYDNVINLGVLDLWFEPVYEEEFKIGDWMTCKRSGTLRFITRIVDKDKFEDDGHKSGQSGSPYCYFDNYRLATPEEIASIQKKVITLRCKDGMFEIEVSKKGIYYAPDKKYLNSMDLKHMIEKNHKIGKGTLNEYYQFTYTHVDSGCKKEVPIEDWKKVLDAYNEFQKR